MSRFLAANRQYHTAHKTAGSAAQIAGAENQANRGNPFRGTEAPMAGAYNAGARAASSAASSRMGRDKPVKTAFSLVHPETGRTEYYSSQEDLDKSKMWFDLFEQDKRSARVLADAKKNEASQRTENSAILKQRAAVPLVIERVMVGMLASLEGIRCYHYDKRSDTGCVNCDCTKVSPGVFQVAERHQPGTFFVDDSKVKRQIAVMEAANASGNHCVMNPGGFGQPIGVKNHIRMAAAAAVVMEQPGSF